MKYKLRFDTNAIEELARQYVDLNTDQAAEDRIIEEIGPRVKRNGYYSKDDLLFLCRWKTHRSKRYCAKNEESFVHETTKAALKTQDERLRIEVLTLLDGVEWPTASVLLHFGHVEPYPILDYRALWSLNISQPSQYTYSFWLAYVGICRGLARECNLPMRTLDRALWEYSKENQRV